MRTLQAYVEQKNKWRAVFGSAPLSLASATDRQRIAETIDAELSPENLTCDGELSNTEVRARHKQLITAAKQLAELDPKAAMAIYELYTGE
jgi:hypothetical protein